MKKECRVVKDVAWFFRALSAHHFLEQTTVVSFLVLSFAFFEFENLPRLESLSLNMSSWLLISINQYLNAKDF